MPEFTDHGFIQKIERELAYGAARSDIECFCTPEKPPGNYHSGISGRWWNLCSVDLDPENRACVARAVQYLELSKLLKRHPVKHNLVQVLERSK